MRRVGLQQEYFMGLPVILSSQIQPFSNLRELLESVPCLHSHPALSRLHFEEGEGEGRGGGAWFCRPTKSPADQLFKHRAGCVTPTHAHQACLGSQCRLSHFESGGRQRVKRETKGGWMRERGGGGGGGWGRRAGCRPTTCPDDQYPSTELLGCLPPYSVCS